eukprot:4902630-Pleurochrysis_carterae.AAC.1
MLAICGSRDYVSLLYRRGRLRALLADRQLANLPRGGGGPGRRGRQEAAQRDPHRLRLRWHHGS